MTEDTVRPDTAFIFVYITASDESEAKRIASALLEERLIACANIYPIRSLYRWKGALEDDAEVAMLVKTRRKHLETIITRVNSLHSYEVPCIVSIPMGGGNPAFLDWIRNETDESTA